MRRKGFTLIELLAVIVILAILALITVPIVLKLVNNARKDSAVRSAENYLDGVKKAVMNDAINSEVEIEECEVQRSGDVICNGNLPLTIDVDGKKPSSGTISFVSGSISDVSDLRFGKYFISGPVEEMTASTKSATEAREDGVYMVGDKVTYKGEKYYVIKKSPVNEEYVTLLKMFPLTVEEVATYGVGEDGTNHVNVYTYDRQGSPNERGGFGIVAWYSSETCRYMGYQCDNGCYERYEMSGCKTNYDESDIKVIVDNWARNTLNMDDLKKIDGYKVRLLTSKDALNNLKFSTEASGYSSTSAYYMTNKTPKWVRGNDYYYWLMDAYEDGRASVLMIGYSDIYGQKVYSNDRYGAGAIRPVINLNKDALQSNTQQSNQENESQSEPQSENP